MARPLGLVVALLLFAGVARGAAQPAGHPQCRDPLFETHWAGKNDIQTLTEYPHVKTNLKLCPAFNQRASCCHQTFESEQSKYFGFWHTRLENIFFRLNAHREAAIAAAPSNASQTDREQFEVVLKSYAAVLSPGRHQRKCFSTLLTYIAGMMCFACRTDWFYFAVISGHALAGEHVLRLRITRGVCLQLWASCEAFSHATRRLTAAIRDSKLARAAPQAVENIDMFSGQTQLCDWMHDEVALHPFRLPTAEDRQTRWRRLSMNEEAAAHVDANASVGRRLEERKELDILADGEASSFEQRWQTPRGLPPASALGGACAGRVHIGVLVVSAALCWFAL